MKLVITSSESFVGRELVAQCLARKVEVTGVDLIVPKPLSVSVLT